ncbi:hypothetical protein DFA_05650 [Cavenderia fasciculata]|uniref:Uncharacterized protein n=1 Tax=Cavenderia fasciculata TaxID=261658 RepID=F4PLW3_CACFS|nr:uncharacterized protein DFA_05650 [Cavenderia fasciculata]EGG23517.1 hypothetical protein DFA_05650 [Cavenderia fasciculata]|eukprot:XP_004361368.1 hypothetical protein DFA_05650 [Cavenderia fasciculata]
MTEQIKKIVQVLGNVSGEFIANLTTTDKVVMGTTAIGLTTMMYIKHYINQSFEVNRSKVPEYKETIAIALNLVRQAKTINEYECVDTYGLKVIAHAMSVNKSVTLAMTDEFVNIAGILVNSMLFSYDSCHLATTTRPDLVDNIITSYSQLPRLDPIVITTSSMIRSLLRHAPQSNEFAMVLTSYAGGCQLLQVKFIVAELLADYVAESNDPNINNLPVLIFLLSVYSPQFDVVYNHMDHAINKLTNNFLKNPPPNVDITDVKKLVEPYAGYTYRRYCPNSILKYREFIAIVLNGSAIAIGKHYVSPALQLLVSAFWLLNGTTLASQFENKIDSSIWARIILKSLYLTLPICIIYPQFSFKSILVASIPSIIGKLFDVFAKNYIIKKMDTALFIRCRKDIQDFDIYSKKEKDALERRNLKQQQ